MIVTCEGCETSFHVQDNKIKSTGSKVRCSKCRYVFVTYPTAGAEPEETLILQETVPPASVSEDSAILNEIDFNLDEVVSEDAAEITDVPAIALKPEFLDVAELLAEQELPNDEIESDRIDDNLNFDLDLGLSLDGTPEEGAAKANTIPSEASLETEEGLVDFDLSVEPAALEEPHPTLHKLEVNPEDLDLWPETHKRRVAENSETDDISDAEFELDLDLEKLASESDDSGQDVGFETHTGTLFEPLDTAEKESVANSVGATDEPELELDFNTGETASYQRNEAGPLPDAEDELDISDLEAILEGVEEEVANKPSGTEPIGMELDLQAPVSGDILGEEIRGIDLTGIADPTGKGDASLDFGATDENSSDLSEIIEEGAPVVGAKDTNEPAERVDLIFEEQLQMEREETKPMASSPIEDGLMLDLEKLLEPEEERKPAAEEIAAKAIDDTDASFEPESVRDPAGELEIESLTDSDEMVDEQSPAVAAPDVFAASTGAGMASAAGISARSVGATATDDDSISAQSTPNSYPADDIVMDAVKEAASTERKVLSIESSSGIRKFILSAAVIAVLAIAALAIPRGLGIHVPYLSDVEIPFLDKILQAEPEDTAGNLKVMVVQESVSVEFVENLIAGRICVIQGKVRNNYDHARNFIRVTGKLYDKNKNVVKTTTVFAGNPLTKDELAGKEFAAISSHLKNRNGVGNLNVGVKAGASIPFLVVFEKLPENLDEYSVEVAGSSR